MALPPDIDNHVSERSRKFYDGTYKWDADGFTDDAGVYRRFDCSDPDARAPTPLLPQFPEELELGDEAEDVDDESGIVTETPSVSSLFDEVAGPSPDVSSESQDVLARKSIDARVAEEQPEDAKRAEVEAPKRAITPPEIMKRTVAPVQNQTPFSGKVKIKMKKAHFPAKTLQVPAKTMTPVPTKTTQAPAKTTTTLGLLETMQVPAKTTPAPTKTSTIPVKASPSSDGLSDVPSNISAPPSSTPIRPNRKVKGSTADDDDYTPAKPKKCGVAQKVVRKAKASQKGYAKVKDTHQAIAATPTLLSMQVTTVADGTSRRRSTRQMRGQGGA